MNFNIKYQRKPVYSWLDDLPKTKEKRVVMTCISGVSDACTKTFLTTKENRICKYCKRLIEEGGLV